MNKRLRDLEHAEILNGNELLFSCPVGHCEGLLAVPFAPGNGGAPGAVSRPELGRGPVWKRESGETLDDITISPSVNAFECGHFFIRNGEIVFA